MKDENRKILTEFLEECWHKVVKEEPITSAREVEVIGMTSLFTCSCGKLFNGTIIGKHIAFANRTFDTWEDFGALIERVEEKDQWDDLFYSDIYHTIKLRGH